MININVVNWAKRFLDNKGFEYKNDFQAVRLMPWSKVWCLPTREGKIYLKVLSKPYEIEMKLLPYLTTHVSSHTPHVIALNPAYRAILMKDHGTPLRNRLNTSYDEELVLEVFNDYIDIQRGLESELGSLFELGVLDWRTEKLPFLFETFLNEEGSLLINDGLTKMEFRKLSGLLAKLHETCEQALEYGVLDSIEHGDFHDNNILIKAETLCFNDWGDAVVTHPFISLQSFLISAERRHDLKEGTELYVSLRDQYLSRWKDVLSYNELLSLFELIKIINPIKFVLGFSRIADCGENALEKYKGYMASALKAWLELIKKATV